MLHWTFSRLLFASAFFLLPSHGIHGQGVSVGDRVRVTAPRLLPEPTEATLLAIGGDSLIAQAPLGRLAVPTSDIRRLEVVEDVRRNTALGGLVGALVFFAFAELSTASAAPTEAGSINTGFTLIGAGLGMIVGSQIRSRSWTDAQLPLR